MTSCMAAPFYHPWRRRHPSAVQGNGERKRGVRDFRPTKPAPLELAAASCSSLFSALPKRLRVLPVGARRSAAADSRERSASYVRTTWAKWSAVLGTRLAASRAQPRSSSGERRSKLSRRFAGVRTPSSVEAPGETALRRRGASASGGGSPAVGDDADGETCRRRPPPGSGRTSRRARRCTSTSALAIAVARSERSRSKPGKRTPGEARPRSRRARSGPSPRRTGASPSAGSGGAANASRTRRPIASRRWQNAPPRPGAPSPRARSCSKAPPPPVAPGPGPKASPGRRRRGRR